MNFAMLPPSQNRPKAYQTPPQARTESAYPERTAFQLSMVADYFTLLKPRVMSLVVFTALIGLVIAPVSMNPVMAFLAVCLIAIGAGASGALNMWYEADIDALMTRTKTRPIPAGRVPRMHALIFGLSLSFAAIISLGLFINWLAAGLLAFTIFFYAIVFTIWLNRLTPQNIVIGGAAGAFPPVIGWAAATGSIGIYPLILFAIIFFWTPPHFWALALLKHKEYAAANIPMLPVIAGARATRTQILIYSFVLAGFAFLPCALGYAGLFYGLGAGLLNIIFVTLALWLFMAEPIKGKRAAGFLFAYSIIYLFLLFGLLPLDMLVGIGS